MKFRKYLLSILPLICGLFLFSKSSLASEGTVELRSVTDKPYSCFATSVLMEYETYKVIVTCRNLLYPPQVNLFAYMMWGTPLEGNNPVRFGELGKGKASFDVREGFTNLFVTTEKNSNALKPEGEVVMRGTVESITFLDGQTISTPTETPAAKEMQTEEVQTVGQKLLLTLRRAALVILVVLVVVIGSVIILSRSRRIS